jgi:hypothetical protein
MTGFVVNIVKPGTLMVHRTLHLPACRYAGLARRYYFCDETEVLRLLLNRVHRNDVRTVFCTHCRPLTEIREWVQPAG